MGDWKKKSRKILNTYCKHFSADVCEPARKIMDEILLREEVCLELASHCYLRIFPMIALYRALKKDDAAGAYERASQLFWDTQVFPGTVWVRRLLKIPGLYRLIPRLAAFAVQNKYKPSPDGFQYAILDATFSRFRVNFRQCPYYSYCLKYGVPELCDVFCTSDEIVAQAMAPHIVFSRTQTLGRGGDCCDFCYEVNVDSAKGETTILGE